MTKEEVRQKYEGMTVPQLKEVTRDRGLKLQKDGKKFNKTELIENLMNTEVFEVKENKTEIKTNKEIPENEYIAFAKTLDEIKTKYGNRKKQTVYDNELQEGSFVVFLHYVEAKDGNIYEKLRTAKVKEVDRKDECVIVTTLLGTEIKLGFEDLLYIRKNQVGCSYPVDISTYLKGRRTEKGRSLINEKFTEGNGTN